MDGRPQPKDVSIEELPPGPGEPIQPITVLPNEIIALVGEQLPFEDLANARQTCRLLHRIWSPIYFKRACTEIMSTGETGFIFALARDRVAAVQQMLKVRPDLAVAMSRSGSAPLHIAARQKSVDMVKLLLHEGHADCCKQEENGFTPLHWAAPWSLEVVRTFVDFVPSPSSVAPAGTEAVNIKNKDGETPIILAAKARNTPVVDFLLSRGVDTAIPEGYGSCPLHRASSFGFTSSMRKLLEAGNISVNSQDNTQSTPLHLAASSRRPEAVRLLLEAGADVTARDCYGYTPLHYSICGEGGDIVRMLLDAGADIEARNNRGETPLHHASEMPPTCLDSVKALLKAGASIYLETDDSDTPVSFIKSKRILALMEQLSSDRARQPE